MPQGEKFWNPYRWVTVSDKPVEHDVPNYHHTFSGVSGRLWCELEALTPLLIGNGQQNNVEFVRHNRHPYIPSTSLKGPIRSLAEVVGNATVPTAKTSIDSEHELGKARGVIGGVVQYDAVARIFGYWQGSNALTGLVHFSDAKISVEPLPQNRWEQFSIAGSHPKPEHDAFYPNKKNKRKFYHHHHPAPEAAQLTKPHSGVRTTNVRPAPLGTCFTFTVDFTNLRDAEFNLLLYCLVLEEEVTVSLSPAAIGREASEGGVLLKGPLRHKIGGAKPHGAGSSCIRITKMELCRDAMARYRGNKAADILEKEVLTEEIKERTKSFRERTDLTMEELRAMLIYTVDDPRKPIYYPTYDWFQDEKKKRPEAKTQLKPTV